MLQKILAHAVTIRASDIHLAEGNEIAYRVNGHLNKLSEAGIITKAHAQELLRQLCGSEDRYQLFLGTHDIDFAFIAQDGTPFRVNAFMKLGKIALVLRRIEQQSKSMKDLGLPDSLSKVITAKQGLFLVTGPTGSGKSTTLVSLIDEINRTRSEHIITIEDPIEFIFSDKQSIFSQREVGRDTQNFVQAIRAAMREDPDVVLVGEMRDKETVEAALNLAETGHLVFSTLHTSGSVQTISRLVQFFPPDIQVQTRMRVADSLLGVLSQRLVSRADGKGRIAILELMFLTGAIKNLIKTGDFAQIHNNIELGSSDGMITMLSYAQRLEAQGLITKDSYLGYFTNDYS